MNQPDLRSTQCIILVGGMGTRLGGLTAECPKPLLPVADKPFLAYLMWHARRHGFTDFILLAGYRSEQIKKFAEGPWARQLDCRIRVLAEQAPAGTGGALALARDWLSTNFLMMNGDSLFDFNILDLVSHPLDQGMKAWLALRQVEDATRYGTVDLANGQIAAFRERPERGGAALVNGGVYWLSRSLVSDIPGGFTSLERDVLPKLAVQGRVGGVVYDGFFLDIGIPSDFSFSQTSVPDALTKPAVFFDRDGVLNHDEQGYTHKIEDFCWNEGAKHAIKMFNDNGWYVFVVTNQAGIAKGYYDEAAVLRLHHWMNAQLREMGAHVDEFQYCPHHPDGSIETISVTCGCRKPEPGMIFEIMKKWPIQREHSLLIGDKESDIIAADRAGIRGILFKEAGLAQLAEQIIFEAFDK